MQLTPWNGPFGKAGWGGGGGWGGAVTAHKILISQQIKWTSRYSEPCCLIGSMCSAWWFTKTHTHHGIHTVWHIFSIYGMHTADSMHMPTVCTCARTVVCTYTPWQAHSMACTHTMTEECCLTNWHVRFIIYWWLDNNTDTHIPPTLALLHKDSLKVLVSNLVFYACSTSIFIAGWSQSLDTQCL